MFESSLKLKELSYKITVATSEAVGSGVRLPKLETPKFDRNLLNWRVFWEQFKVSVHERNIPDSEKLVYLQNALKDGAAKGVIEGLLRFYSEAIGSLHARYDRPRLLHQTHVKMIMDAPALKDGNGKELIAQLFYSGWMAAQGATKCMWVTVFQPSLIFLLADGTMSMAVKIQLIVDQEDCFLLSS